MLQILMRKFEKMKFNEDSRVKIPSILHLTRLGYSYLSLKDAIWDEQANICTDIFKSSIDKINPNSEDGDNNRLLDFHLNYHKPISKLTV